ncbi:MAG: D-glucuronyl C5-epimerase family protein, partial [Candidatus Binatia bacterium]
MTRADHFRRVVDAYVLRRQSHVSFWRERPAAHPAALAPPYLPYPMTFADKARYTGPFDAPGVPVLDYRGAVGRQYNPIAIAQYALAWMNRQVDGEVDAERHWRPSVEWLHANLERNEAGLSVWFHRFDWPYRETLRNPWFSGLAQGQGISALLRAARLTGDARYSEAAHRAYEPLETPTSRGGVLYVGESGDPWIEEYLVDPPSHILNGFLWALWGVHDMIRLGGSVGAERFFERCVVTLRKNLARYDNGY